MQTAFVDRIFPQIEVKDKQSFTVKGMIELVAYAAFLSVFFYVLHLFKVDNTETLITLSPFMVGAFIIHALLPARYKPAFFVLLYPVFAIYGLGLVSGSVVWGFLLLFFVVLKLPLQHWLKVLIVISLLAVLGILRMELFYAPRLLTALPFVASIIIFRVIIWLYEIKYAPINDNHWLQLCYFFSFPNLAFLFFPIVDYKMMVKTYYNEKATNIYKSGVYYLLLALLQLVLYRVNQYLLEGIEVTNLFTLGLFFINAALGMLRFSGLLTMAIALLYFFGFNLPPVFGNYLAAPSFAQYWRRVNIYWREFLMKLIYYPAFFALRKKWKGKPIIASLLLVFIASCFFHWYQLFFIGGRYMLKLNDILFWLMLAALVIANVITGGGESTVKQANPVRKALSSLVVFFVMAFLISFWNAPNIQSWLDIIVRGFAGFSMGDLFAVVIVFMCAALLLFIICISSIAKLLSSDKWQMAGLICLFLLVVGIYFGNKQFMLSKSLTVFFENTGNAQLARSEEDAGYYESLVATGNGWNVNIKNLNNSRALDNITIKTGDILLQKLTPNQQFDMGTYTITTNTYGLRDKEYVLAKPAGVYRIALLGGSYEFGSGVNDSCVFEVMTEKMQEGKKVEIINFSMGLYTCLQQAYLMDNAVLQFNPDAVVVFAHTDEPMRFPSFFARYVRNGVDMKYPYLRDVIAKSGAKQYMDNKEIADRLKPYTADLFKWAYASIAGTCKGNGVDYYWVFLPTTKDVLTEEKINTPKAWAESVGFKTMAWPDLYKGYTPTQVAVSENDPHLNCLGHALVAAKFYSFINDSILHQQIPVN
jgi:hypothetical protein